MEQLVDQCLWRNKRSRLMNIGTGEIIILKIEW